MTTTGVIPVWLGIRNGAVLRVDARNHVANLKTGHVFVPRAPETLTHDADGNLLSDSRWTYTWDAENWLLLVQSRSDTPQASWRRVEWQYDALGRRIRQTTWSWLVQSNLWVVTEDLGMVSDPLLFGRHVIELNASNNALVRSYVWGLDLSESMDGAGGVGGLLWVTLHPGSGAGVGTHYCAYDGNGNVVALSAASDGSVTARYEYGPFGEQIRVTGPAAALNPFRFSTKRADPTSDLVLYEYRAYSPALGRWLSRDPIGEKGGLNLHEFVRNRPIILVDPKGQSPVVVIVVGAAVIYLAREAYDCWQCSGALDRWQAAVLECYKEGVAALQTIEGEIAFYDKYDASGWGEAIWNCAKRKDPEGLKRVLATCGRKAAESWVTGTFPMPPRVPLN